MERGHKTTWNWQREDWPACCIPPEKPEAERLFLSQSRRVEACMREARGERERKELYIQTLVWEGFHTSKIEGIGISRPSLQASFRRRMGLAADRDGPLAGTKPDNEWGLAEMLSDLLETYDEPLTHDMMLKWHLQLCRHRREMTHVGDYRAFQEPMQVVSVNAAGAPEKVHFVAPGSSDVLAEMDRFVDMWERTGPRGRETLDPLRRAAWAHLHFVSIHPFEDGNGRLARQLAAKACMEGLGSPMPYAMASRISHSRSEYYDALSLAQRQAGASPAATFGDYMASVCLEGQRDVLLDLFSAKAQAAFLEKAREGDEDGSRAKLVSRLFLEWPNGFKGGLSLKNASAIARVSEKRAESMLSDLVEMGVLRVLPRSRGGKGVRYDLDLAVPADLHDGKPEKTREHSP